MKRMIHVAMVGAVAALLVSFFSAGTALAHPLGNFTVNRYAGLDVQPGAIAVDYVVDMAEIPAYQEVTQAIDKDRNGAVDETENLAYREDQCLKIPAKLRLTMNGKPLTLSLAAMALEFPPGAGGLLTLRLTCSYKAPMEPGTPAIVAFRDDNFADRIGWREIVVQGDGTEIRDADAPSASISNRLTSYPNDLTNSPLRQSETHFAFTISGAGSVSNAPAVGGMNAVDRRNDALAELVIANDLTWPVVLLSLLVAFGLGALHALSPGHGKTIMAAYLVSTHGTLTQGLMLGLTVTITHTFGVLILGLITLFASRYILPESLYPLLSLSSGILVVGMGIALVIDRWRSRKPLHHHHNHNSHDISRDHHSHEPHHLDRGGSLAWKNLVGLGLVGGLVPSSSALLLLLAAISLQRIPFGIVLIVAFGMGMALVLIGIGVLLVRTGDWIEKRRIPGRIFRTMTLASPLFVICAGLVVTVEACLQLGWMGP